MKRVRLFESYDPTAERERLEPQLKEIEEKLFKLVPSKRFAGPNAMIENIRILIATVQPSHWQDDWYEAIIIRGDVTIKKPFKKTEVRQITYARIDGAEWRIPGGDRGFGTFLIEKFGLEKDPRYQGTDEFWLDPVLAQEMRGQFLGAKTGITEKKGLWANIHAKRKRGEKPAKPGDEDYPDEESWEAAQENQNTQAMKHVKLFEEFELNEWNPYYTEDKDLMRIGDILKKAATVEHQDQRALGEAKKMAKLIKAGDKAVRRARATQEMKDERAWERYQRQYGTVSLSEEQRLALLDLISAVFFNRAMDLNMKGYLKPEEIEIVRGAAVSYDLGIL